MIDGSRCFYVGLACRNHSNVKNRRNSRERKKERTNSKTQTTLFRDHVDSNSQYFIALIIY